MPTYSTLEALLARIIADMTANGANENTGTRTQLLLKDMAASLIAIIGAVPAATGSIQPWDEGLEYTDQVLVSHNGFLWLFAGGPPDTGTQPGTDDAVWLSLGAPPAPNLEQVLAVGHTTGANNIEVSSGQRIDFRGPESEGTLSLRPISVSDDNTIYLPDRYGTVALVEDLDAQDLHAVLVNGSETNGRSITVSEFDGVNFEQGANMARVKAPASLTALRTLLLPDKDGTLATTAEVDAVAALIDGTLKAPEAFAPSGSYPTTFAGVAISRGDTFRLSGGAMGARTVDSEDLAVALVDTPGQTDGNWQVIESNRVVATQAQAEDSASTNTALLVPPQRWWQAWTKGLTLSGFFSAVRGVVLTGYTAGANTAITATDSILAAFGKVQGQVNAINTAVTGKLAKASNLSDVTNVGASRTNLGLKSLAIQDYAECLVDQSFISQEAHGFAVGDLVRYDNTGWHRSSVENGLTAQVLGMVIEVPEPNAFRILRRGYWRDPAVFGSLTAGAQYYLSGSGGWTDVRPDGIAVPVFVAMSAGERAIDFSVVPKWDEGSVTGHGLDTTEDIGSGGEVTGLEFFGLEKAVYAVRLSAVVQTSGLSNYVACAIVPDSGKIVGTLVKQWASDGRCATQAFVTAALNTDATHIEQAVDMAYVIDAEVTIDTGGTVRVFVATDDSAENAHLAASSRLTWKRIA
ncbi:MAG: hypothetical protein IPH00_16505 [Flavobacteriales bacterium]|nr:hypothetical protein [Flavobacteriales bacterium]MBK7247257.1 hypothetical protein [Flavobacteriales bacterium]HQY04111.1 hypothetical protein [Flavobacteriales bacterium]